MYSYMYVCMRVRFASCNHQHACWSNTATLSQRKHTCHLPVETKTRRCEDHTWVVIFSFESTVLPALHDQVLIVVSQSNDELGEFDTILNGHFLHLSVVDQAHPSVLQQQNVPRVRVAVEVPVEEQLMAVHLEHHVQETV
jgi:hypothetical protein